MSTVNKTLAIPAELLSKIPGIGPLVRACCTSVGQKIVMAITGLSLTGFLVTHLGGNLNLFLGEAAFNGYAEKLHSLGPLLKIAEIGLFAVFIAHLGLAISTNAMSRKARKNNYEVKESKQSGFILPNGGAANMMLATGVLLAVYMVIHVLDMKLNIRGFEDNDSKYQLVRAVLADPKTGLFYAIALIGMGIHLSHGIKSSFLTLGINHKRWNTLLKIAGIVLAWLLAAGFLAVLASAYALPAAQ